MVSLGTFAALIAAFATEGSGNWMDDYGAALRQAEAEGRPLLVVIGNPGDQRAVTHLATLRNDPRADKLLAPYKLCRIDTSTDYGQRVAKAFRATSFPHTVVIDNTASVKLFKHTGEMTAADWQTTLVRFASGERVEGSTVTSAQNYTRYCPNCR